MTTQPTSEKKRLPMWAYVVAFLFGPVTAFIAILILMRIVDFLTSILGEFDHWWAVGLIVLYLICGAVCAGLLNTIVEKENE